MHQPVLLEPPRRQAKMKDDGDEYRGGYPDGGDGEENHCAASDWDSLPASLPK